LYNKDVELCSMMILRCESMYIRCYYLEWQQRRCPVKINIMTVIVNMGFGPMAPVAFGAYSPHRPKVAGMRPVGYSLHGPPPSPMPRRRSNPGSDARRRSPDVILGFAELRRVWSLLSHLYIPVSLSLLFRQSLL
jgi:hypothetical protein